MQYSENTHKNKSVDATTESEAKRGGGRDDMGPISFSVQPYEESRRGSRVEVVANQSKVIIYTI